MFWCIKFRLFRHIFCKKKLEDISLLVEPLISLVCTLVTSALGFIARVVPLPTCNRFLRFTSGATPADLFAASMVTDLFRSTYLRTSIAWARVLKTFTLKCTNLYKTELRKHGLLFHFHQRMWMWKKALQWVTAFCFAAQGCSSGSGDETDGSISPCWINIA